ncbi:MAG: AraC family transcriptional regulator [Spirochaetales bacterium]|nr:AraC family transcriptional regulator [Leptospiraceae bacterium]MCP5483087.1 AraC family transcriptional regulator [Spirochaetales bacterium]MCP5486105.1 AraC family transcriptional regulator [Spirochaetales bacterium]
MRSKPVRFELVNPRRAKDDHGLAMVSDVFRFLSVSHLLLLLMLFLARYRRARGAIQVLAMCLLLVLEVLLPYISEGSSPAGWASAVLPPTVAFLFWWFSETVFLERFRLRWWHSGLFILSLAVLTALWWWPADLGPAARGSARAIGWWCAVFGSCVAAAFIASSLVVGLGTLNADLLEWRRRMRVHQLGIGALLLLLFVVARLILQLPERGPLISASTPALLYLGTITLSLVLLQMRPGFLDVSAAPRTAAADKDATLRNALRRSMEEECAYRAEGLTIRKLAVQLATQEYRLRRLINQTLGYRNFNDFLNRYRIEEACRMLVDTPDLPVSRLAPRLGYGSMGPFHRAFKEHTGLTPMEFRARRTARADHGNMQAVGGVHGSGIIPNQSVDEEGG